ncbi:troponin wings up A isoform X2 [Lasioglossum baleicum]|uniref:troponin wings up A isoform X2 n=1 Tax=Lasioglossum baleicum TaxID=434251 RepID=UPI003FCC5FAC
MADDEEKKRKQAETDRKRAEVRARLEEASKAKKAKKGFMTPDRKKKLRLLLRKKAAEELKKEQERKAAERRRIIEERCGKAKDTDNASEANVKSVLTQYHKRIIVLEGQKYDLEYEVAKKDFEVDMFFDAQNDDVAINIYKKRKQSRIPYFFFCFFSFSLSLSLYLTLYLSIFLYLSFSLLDNFCCFFQHTHTHSFGNCVRILFSDYLRKEILLLEQGAE